MFRNVGQVQHQSHNIALFTIIVFIIIIVLDQSGSVWHITTDIVEVSEVGWVGKDYIVRYTLDGLLWWLYHI